MTPIQNSALESLRNGYKVNRISNENLEIFLYINIVFHILMLIQIKE